MVHLRLKLAMVEAGMTGVDIAARLGKHHTQFSRQLHGVRPFSAEDRRNVAKILRRPERDLFPDPT
jgi:transcriptional regulator with XRE-family HTH domain